MCKFISNIACVQVMIDHQLFFWNYVKGHLRVKERSNIEITQKLLTHRGYISKPYQSWKDFGRYWVIIFALWKKVEGHL